MRHLLVAAALVAGVAGPALAQNRTLPAGSQNAAQPPIDWSAGVARRWALSHGGQFHSNSPVVIVPAPDDDLD